MADDRTTYCLRTLPAPGRCYHCCAEIEPGLAGYYYTHPLCPDCFRDCEPTLAAILAGAPSPAASLAISLKENATCIRCDRSIRSWLAGRDLDGPYCRRCLLEVEPALAAILLLEEAARALVEDGAPREQYVELVRRYAATQATLFHRRGDRDRSRSPGERR